MSNLSKILHVAFLLPIRIHEPEPVHEILLITVNVLKLGTLSLCYQKRAEIHKMFVRIAKREDPDQTAYQFDLGLHCLSWHFRTYTVSHLYKVSL